MKKINHAMEQRISRILHVVALCGMKRLVLGAFGCGVFQNAPQDIANIFKKLLDGPYLGYFSHIYFAIPEDAMNENKVAFDKVFF
jgi:uncharacterized protein (TIGR02452 family)